MHQQQKTSPKLKTTKRHLRRRPQGAGALGFCCFHFCCFICVADALLCYWFSIGPKAFLRIFFPVAPEEKLLPTPNTWRAQYLTHPKFQKLTKTLKCSRNGSPWLENQQKVMLFQWFFKTELMVASIFVKTLIFDQFWTFFDFLDFSIFSGFWGSGCVKYPVWKVRGWLMDLGDERYHATM